MPMTTQTWTYLFDLSVIAHGGGDDIAHTVVERRGYLTFDGRLTADGLRDHIVADIAKDRGVAVTDVTVSRFTCTEID